MAAISCGHNSPLLVLLPVGGPLDNRCSIFCGLLENIQNFPIAASDLERTMAAGQKLPKLIRGVISRINHNIFPTLLAWFRDLNSESFRHIDNIVLVLAVSLLNIVLLIRSSMIIPYDEIILLQIFLLVVDCCYIKTFLFVQHWHYFIFDVGAGEFVLSQGPFEYWIYLIAQSWYLG